MHAMAAAEAAQVQLSGVMTSLSGGRDAVNSASLKADR